MSDTPSEKDFMQFFEDRKANQTKALEFLAGMKYRPVLADYNEVTIDHWKLHKPDERGIAKDYVGKVAQFDNIILENISGIEDDKGVWMSLSSMELQSHIIHLNSLINIAQAEHDKGNVPKIVIGGMGMGMFTLSALFHLNELDIEASVTVIEIDPTIIEVLEESLSGYSSHKFQMAINGFEMASLDIVIGDIMEAETFEADYMYVDIWKGLATDEAPIMSDEIIKLWKPKAYGYWGEEIDVAAYGQPLVERLNLAYKYDTPEAMQFCKAVFLAQTEFLAPEEPRSLSKLLK